MRTIISAAMSLDGRIDDCTPERLRLSSPEDWAAVAAMRSRCDAILVGAGTVRADNPSLLVRDPLLRQRRIEAGMEADICKVTITRSGEIDPGCDFFTRGAGRKVVFTTEGVEPGRLERLRGLAQVFTEREITPAVIEKRLTSLGYRSLFVEGGTSVLGMYFKDGRADLVRIAVAPFIVGDPEAPGLLPGGGYPWGGEHRLVIRAAGNVGGTAVIEMVPDKVDAADRRYMAEAVRYGKLSPPSPTAYCVGAVLVTADGKRYGGYTHETGPSNHAEEEALAKAENAGAVLRGSTVYSSMEPCTHRKSKPLSCCDLLISKGISKVVYALPEPAALAPCEGHGRLSAAGIEVARIEGFDREVIATNAHILGR